MVKNRSGQHATKEKVADTVMRRKWGRRIVAVAHARRVEMNKKMEAKNLVEMMNKKMEANLVEMNKKIDTLSRETKASIVQMNMKMERLSKETGDIYVFLATLGVSTLSIAIQSMSMR